MKVADNQTLPVGKHFELVDTWRQEWEKGVQVRQVKYTSNLAYGIAVISSYHRNCSLHVWQLSIYK